MRSGEEVIFRELARNRDGADCGGSGEAPRGAGAGAGLCSGGWDRGTGAVERVARVLGVDEALYLCRPLPSSSLLGGVLNGDTRSWLLFLAGSREKGGTAVEGLAARLIGGGVRSGVSKAATTPLACFGRSAGPNGACPRLAEGMASAARIAGEPALPLTAFFAGDGVRRWGTGRGSGFGGEAGDCTFRAGGPFDGDHGMSENGRCVGDVEGLDVDCALSPPLLLSLCVAQEGGERGASNDERVRPASPKVDGAPSLALLVCEGAALKRSKWDRREDTGFYTWLSNGLEAGLGCRIDVRSRRRPALRDSRPPC